MWLQVRSFPPGAWLVRQGERSARSHEVYLITAGEASVFLHAAATPAEEGTPLCIRRPGNFVGALQLHCVPEAPSGSPQKAGVGVPAGVAAQRAAADAAASPPEAPAAAPGSPPGGGGASSGGLCKSGSLPWAAGTWPEGRTARAASSLPLRTVLMLLRVARRWVGYRRTLSVRADTEVTAIVLSHDDMRWAVAHDYRMSGELMAALKKRKLSVVRAIRAAKKQAAALRDAA